MLRGPICPKISPKWKIISAKTARNLPKLRKKLRSMAKIARLRENAKVAQKLRSATSQFSGGINYGTRMAAIVNVHRFVIKSSLSTGSGSVRVRRGVVGRLGLGLGLALGLQLGIRIGFRRNHSWSSIFTPRRNHSQ